MAFDFARGKTIARDWSCGARHGTFVPETFWGPSQMEAKAAEFMSKPKGPFGLGGKPTKEEALKMVADFMRANKIGPSTTNAGIGAFVGSVLFPEKEQKKMLEKVDDLRFDVRNAKSVIGAGIFALSGALAFVAISKIYRANKAGGR